jgi:hypothetical protein
MSRSIPNLSVGTTLAGLLCAGLVSAWTPAAPAHIRLLEPLPRYEITGIDTGIKSCPCGLGGSNRTCDVEADGSDPSRDAERASTFEAGSTITLRFEEYIDHSGRYRVAFDPDGADVADFNANILLDVEDPSGGMSDWELEVTLPDTPCENCTIQLIQAMHGDTQNPVEDPSNLSTYYTCIDVTLTAAGGAPDPEMMEPIDPEMMDPEMMDPIDPEIEDPAMMPEPIDPEPGMVDPAQPPNPEMPTPIPPDPVPPAMMAVDPVMMPIPAPGPTPQMDPAPVVTPVVQPPAVVPVAPVDPAAGGVVDPAATSGFVPAPAATNMMAMPAKNEEGGCAVVQAGVNGMAAHLGLLGLLGLGWLRRRRVVSTQLSATSTTTGK